MATNDLCIAAENNDRERIPSLASRTRINDFGQSGVTPLQAAFKGTVETETVQLLLNCGADVNARGRDGSTALHSAVMADNGLEGVRTLLDNGADPNAERAELPLAMAINRQDLPMIDALLDAGAEMDRWTDRWTDRSVMRHQFSALALALDTKCPEPIIASLLQHGADPNGHGLSIPPLGRVTDEHDLAIVDTLLDYGARTNPVGKETPQFMAALNGHVAVCKRITERIGDAAGIDTAGMGGYTALAFRVAGIDEKDDAIAQRLLDAGASPQKAMESSFWQDAMRCNRGQGTEMTAIIARRREGEVLREAIVEAQQEVVQEEEQPAPARARRRL
ncbi:TPA: ankyrin repeat domain-containing protein [Burkholderia vietnamiensis]|nr:ankyrin repeat domain-containing protein [Burkholderia vietnamiensis]